MNRRKKRGGRKLLAQTNKSSKMEEMNRGEGGGGIVSRLPLDVITEILSRLPADLLVQCCRRVCKYWRYVIDHPDFAYHHTLRQFGKSLYLIPPTHTSSSSSGLFLCTQQTHRVLRLMLVEYNDQEEEEEEERLLVPEFKITTRIYDDDHPFPLGGTFIITSCNGLVFMGPTKPMDMFVCNLFTREYVSLCTPTHTPNDMNTCSGMAYGFGYHPNTNAYKVVRIYYDCYGGGKGHVSVYTLGSGTIGWRNKGEIPYNNVLSIIDRRPGLFANGAIHWYTYYEDDMKIVSFDLADEEFRVVVPLPPVPVPPSPYYINQLGVLGGCLCLTRSYTINKNIPRDVWIFNFNKEEEGREKEFSWNKIFSIPGTWKKEIGSQAEPCAFLKSGKVLLRGDHGITSYDPKTEAFYEGAWTFPAPFCCKRTIVPYTKSFVSLKALGEKDAKCFGRFVSLKGKSYFTEDFASEFGNLAFC